ncbi:MAG: N-acetylmuramic acid 6-phosphate etherase [Bacteroidia bacterium]
MKLTTESESNHSDLEQKSSKELLIGMNKEDKTVAHAIETQINQIAKAVDLVYSKMNEGGRLFYIGSGTSGRLGIVDASECPPTYGVPHGWVIGIIAGGDQAIRKAVEFAEDDVSQGWKDLEEHKVNEMDIVLGISASGSTPYVKGALEACQQNNISTISLSCNKNSAIAEFADQKIEIVVGPEFVTGSTRMKSGTAQKLVLNMISTAVMVKLGRVSGNKMVDMQLSNHKLVKRGTEMVAKATGLDFEAAKSLLLEKGSVRQAINAHQGK